jgi:hypothetical protein
VLRCDHHEIDAEYGIGPGSKNAENIISLWLSFNFKINLGSKAFANPIALDLFHGFTEINFFKSLQ